MRGFIKKSLFGIAGVMLLPVLGVGGALAVEMYDPFCAACHTEPETTYYSRTRSEKKADLAAFHAPKQTRCIDCHSGGGQFGRVKGLQQGAHDLLNFVTGRYQRPAVTTNPLGDDSCVKCHTKTLARKAETRASAGMGLLGHYHFYLLKWQAEDIHAARCATCHTAHTTGIAALRFMQQGVVGALCDECHTSLSGKVQ